MQSRTAFVALGANLGNAAQTLVESLDRLRALSDGQRLRVSRLYVSDAQEVNEVQPDYFNAAVSFETCRLARDVLLSLHQIERDFGRQRTVWHGARTLDLDLLLLGDEVSNDPSLRLPHPGIANRAFVLQPLLDLDPQLTVPGLGTVKSLLSKLSSQSLRLAEYAGWPNPALQPSSSHAT